ncbi:MAG: hypothetical protein FE78DRAFT_73495 [Acidomyces sp. 'richmondensis']|nr:MAG: hypothetical protein FE78DRAFT_73495 [Acidomyces sp. 'richmondensis']
MYFTIHQRTPNWTGTLVAAHKFIYVANAGPENDLDFQVLHPVIWPRNSIRYQSDDPYAKPMIPVLVFLLKFGMQSIRHILLLLEDGPTETKNAPSKNIPV